LSIETFKTRERERERESDVAVVAVVVAVMSELSAIDRRPKECKMKKTKLEK